MLTIQKPIYGKKAYFYGVTAMVLCSVCAVTTIAWGSSLKDRSVARTTNKSDSVVRSTAGKNKSKSSGSSKDTPAQSNVTENIVTPEVSTESPAVQSVQQPVSSTAPTPKPKPSPTPSPTPSPAPDPTPAPIPTPTPDPVSTDPVMNVPAEM